MGFGDTHQWPKAAFVSHLPLLTCATVLTIITRFTDIGNAICGNLTAKRCMGTEAEIITNLTFWSVCAGHQGLLFCCALYP